MIKLIKDIGAWSAEGDDPRFVMLIGTKHVSASVATRYAVLRDTERAALFEENELREWINA